MREFRSDSSKTRGHFAFTMYKLFIAQSALKNWLESEKLLNSTEQTIELIIKRKHFIYFRWL